MGSVTGPIVVTLVAAVAGAVAGGVAGAVAGVLIGVMTTAAVAAGAAAWTRQIGVHLDAEEMRQVAPRPPGFGALCDAVYARLHPASRNHGLP